jgi:hypothetical protein
LDGSILETMPFISDEKSNAADPRDVICMNLHEEERRETWRVSERDKKKD